MPELDVSLPSVLVPMDRTLPGWPAVDNPPMLTMAFLILGIPLALAAVFVVVGMAGRWRRQSPGAADGTDVAAPMERNAVPAARPAEELPAPVPPAATAAVRPTGQLPGSATPAPARPDAP